MLKLSALESKFLDALVHEVNGMATEEGEFTDKMIEKYSNAGIGFSVRNYGL